MKPLLITVHGQPCIAGLKWSFIHRTRTRGLRVLARSENASHFVAPLSGEGQRLGCIALTGEKIRGTPVSLALALLPALRKKGANGMAVFDCGDGRYWFVALDEGEISVLSDIWGNITTVQAAVAEYQRFRTAEQAFCIAPDGFFPGHDTTAETPEALLPKAAWFQRQVSRHACRLHPVSTQKSTARLVLTAAGLVGCWFGWQHWQALQQQKHDQQEHAAFLARQAKSQKPVIAPWNTLPSPAGFVTRCSQRWQALPLSIAGWTFSQAECGQDSRGHLSLATRYRRHDGVPVGDFAARLPVYYPVNATFDIPGAAGTALFVLPVRPGRQRAPETLLNARQLLTKLTSWSQRLNADLMIRRATLNSKAPLPYSLWHYTLKTDIPPENLFSQPFPGVSVSKITLSMNPQQARLHYVLQGEIYAR